MKITVLLIIDPNIFTQIHTENLLHIDDVKQDSII